MTDDHPEAVKERERIVKPPSRETTMPADIARTVDDVRRMAPTAGFYWVRPRGGAWETAELQGTGRNWWFISVLEHFADQTLIGHRIIGPLTPPGAEEMQNE